ncbi:MAG TPA: hypothetical protein VK279_12985 [Solirubrobacteraceae bacterium]|nr:hypothetical protein [Solirubrobacteraceae bacterium]
MTTSARLALALLAATLLTGGLAACGESAEEKAKSNVCDATADIQKQVNALKGLTLSSGAVDQAQQRLEAIDNDLQKIGDNAGELTGEFKSQVQQATQAFSQTVKSVGSSLGQGLNLSGAEAQITGALQSLASSYQQAFADVKC